MDLKQYIGMKVRAARQKRGLTQEQLAESVDKTVETISNIERGHSLTGLDTLERISRSLEVPIRDFFEGLEEGRSVQRSRLVLEQRLLKLIQGLTEAELKTARELMEVLARHRSDSES